MSEHCVALLGRPDRPTDAVEDYCRFLGEALRPQGFDLELARVDWAENGWPVSLSKLRQRASVWRGGWVFLQYTALAWSQRGFPLGFWRVVRVLRRTGARVCIVYHDAQPYAGSRWIDRLRRSVQLSSMRRALHASDLAILTVPLEKTAWLPPNRPQIVFIPVGPNLPVEIPQENMSGPARVPIVAIFGITGGEAGKRETEAIIEIFRLVSRQVGNVKLQALGRGAEARERRLRAGLYEFPVELQVSGVVSAAEVARKLSSSDVFLFLRGAISSRRGSAIAGIACGLPVVAFAGPETAAPITEAGVVLAASENPEELAVALTRVLLDQALREELAAKSRTAYQKYFSWHAIATRYAEVLRGAA